MSLILHILTLSAGHITEAWFAKTLMTRRTLAFIGFASAAKFAAAVPYFKTTYPASWAITECLQTCFASST